MLEELVVAHCAPVLAGLKAACMFTSQVDPAELTRLRTSLLPARISVYVLHITGGAQLVYVYRPAALARILVRGDVQAFLRPLGYAEFSPSAVLCHLQRRLISCRSFPHEIGVMLDYPLADVRAFIRSGGRDCLCAGAWKAYTQPGRAAETFRRLHRCRQSYALLYRSGCPLASLCRKQ